MHRFEISIYLILFEKYKMNNYEKNKYKYNVYIYR